MNTKSYRFLLADGNMVQLLSYMQRNPGTVHSRMFQRKGGPLASDGVKLVRHLENLFLKGFAELELRRIRSGVLAKCYSLSIRGQELAELLSSSGIGSVRL